MANKLKNIHYLHDVGDKEKEMMEHAAGEHLRFGNITFKIIKYDGDLVAIRVSQEKNAAGAYHDVKRLVEIVRETFDRFFPGKEVHVNAVEYIQSPAADVTPKWINKMMLETETKLKDICNDTGLDKSNISPLVNGEKPLSQSMKAMFYYYFLSKK